MELHPAARLARRPLSKGPCERYLERLPLSPAQRRALLRRCPGTGRADAVRAMAQLHRALGRDGPLPGNPAHASHRRRMQLAQGTARAAGTDTPQSAAPRRARLLCAPPLNRSSMAPRTWSPAPAAGEPAQAAQDARPADSAQHRRLHRIGLARRSVLLALVVGLTYVATSFMSAVLPYHGTRPLEIAVLVLYTILFGWVASGFLTAACGFLVLACGGDRHAISRSAPPDAPIDAGARTAVIMPICNEDVARVFAGLRATWESLAATGEARHFDFFVLSDSGDADTRVGELAAWLALCRDVNGFGRIFYRWRRHRIKRKSGNVADFCRRWGKNYRYMVVLDADSVMSGDCLAQLVRLMEANPDTGIIQSAPRAAGRDTFYARMQQFATRVYGPLFTAGLHYWQLGESHYWGHNAIIRVAPFMRHCSLARLPGHGSLSGEILSHDFVEAALMRRAGWAVWLAYDLPGSYEEMPPNLSDELKRDQRWCHGNLMNFRLFLSRGLHPAHRAVFMTGVMAYVSAPLWFLSLILSTALLAIHTLTEPQYFVEPNQLFPLWPQWHPEWALSLFGVTATLLFLPKLLAAVLIAARGAQGFGGRLALAGSTAVELVLSALLAPIRMLFHTQFVLGALLGLRARWISPPRDDTQTGWGEALRRHGGHTILGVAWAGFVYWLNPTFLWWLLPVVGALVVSIPISVYTSRVGLGRRLRRARLLLIPEESDPPRELRALAQHLANAAPIPDFGAAVVDPIVNALACATARAGARPSAAALQARRELIALATRLGPQGLTSAHKMALLGDAGALSQLHFMVWTAPDAHPQWHATPTRPFASLPAAANRHAQTPFPVRLSRPGGRGIVRPPLDRSAGRPAG